MFALEEGSTYGRKEKKKTKQTGILKFRFEFVVCFGGFFELD